MIVDNYVYSIVEGYVNVEKGASNVGSVSLDDVYHVLGLKKKLVLVSQQYFGRYVLFSPNEVKVIFDMKKFEGDVLFTRRKKDSLYVLSTSDANVEKT